MSETNNIDKLAKPTKEKEAKMNSIHEMGAYYTQRKGRQRWMPFMKWELITDPKDLRGIMKAHRGQRYINLSIWIQQTIWTENKVRGLLLFTQSTNIKEAKFIILKNSTTNLTMDQ